MVSGRWNEALVIEMLPFSFAVLADGLAVAFSIVGGIVRPGVVSIWSGVVAGSSGSGVVSVSTGVWDESCVGFSGSGFTSDLMLHILVSGVTEHSVWYGSLHRCI